MVGKLLVGSCGSIFRFLCHDWWNFSGVPVAQSFVFCVMVGRLLVGFMWLNPVTTSCIGSRQGSNCYTDLSMTSLSGLNVDVFKTGHMLLSD